MIEQVLNRQFVLDGLASLTANLVEQPSLDHDMQITLEALTAAASAEVGAPSGQPGLDPPQERRSTNDLSLDDVAFISRDPIMSSLQSALEAYFEDEIGAEITAAPSPDTDRRSGPIDATGAASLVHAPRFVGLDDGRRLFDRFSITDPGWICSKIAEGITLFRGPHDFVEQPAPPKQIADDSRLVVVGDWGSGLPRAQKVATEMRAALDAKPDVERHVIHLGDTYYSGWKREYERRFLPYWPVSIGEANVIGSWSVNSNHDMYSGGHAYFDTLLADPRFASQNGSSCFSLANRHWRILGIDTAWAHGRVEKKQRTWIEAEVAAARSAGQKVMLLSHHPIFSAYDNPSADLVGDFSGVVADPGIDVWLWGHEHRLMTFKTHGGVRHARCIGHGGVPVYMWRGDNDPFPAPSDWEYRGRFKSGLEFWAVMGFAVLDLDGPQIAVSYVNEAGTTHRTEILA